jgi:hypothetical protein
MFFVNLNFHMLDYHYCMIDKYPEIYNLPEPYYTINGICIDIQSLSSYIAFYAKINFLVGSLSGVFLAKLALVSCLQNLLQKLNSRGNNKQKRARTTYAAKENIAMSYRGFSDEGLIRLTRHTLKARRGLSRPSRLLP